VKVGGKKHRRKERSYQCQSRGGKALILRSEIVEKERDRVTTLAAVDKSINSELGAKFSANEFEHPTRRPIADDMARPRGRRFTVHVGNLSSGSKWLSGALRRVGSRIGKQR
jgi:hypothetical protein